MTKHSPETLRRAADALAKTYAEIQPKRESGEFHMHAEAFWYSAAQAALDAVFSTDVSEDERRAPVGGEEWLRTPAGIAWHVDDLWQKNKPGSSVKVVEAALAQADAAGYARGRAERKADHVHDLELSAQTDHALRAQLTALQAKHKELLAERDQLYTSGLEAYRIQANTQTELTALQAKYDRLRAVADYALGAWRRQKARDLLRQTLDGSDNDG